VEELLCETRYSVSYRDGEIFRKYFIRPNESLISREIQYSRIAYSNGVPTPKYISKGYSYQHKKPYIELEYIDLETFLSRADYSVKTITNIFSVVTMLNKIPPVQNDTYWFDDRLPEFRIKLETANNVFRCSTEDDIKKIMELIPDSTIHGDLTGTNVCFNNSEIYIVDFEAACRGPKMWDKCYFLASVFTKNIPEYVKDIITEDELAIVQIIAKIRFGRALRKNLRVEERLNCCKIWGNFKKSKDT